MTDFLDMGQVTKDQAKVNDAARVKWLSVIGLGLSLMRNYDPFMSPTHFKITDMMKKMDKTFNATGKNYGSVKGDRTIEDIKIRRRDRWNFLFIAGMVPGCPVQLRLPAHRAVHYSVCDAGRQNQLLRVQHGRGLAEHYREDAHDGHSDQVVRRARPARNLCELARKGA